jgi:hypothetical protein
MPSSVLERTIQTLGIDRIDSPEWGRLRTELPAVMLELNRTVNSQNPETKTIEQIRTRARELSALILEMVNAA